MSKLNVKCYVVQQFVRDETTKTLRPGPVIDVKMTFSAAQALAKAYAPAQVIFRIADKLPTRSPDTQPGPRVNPPK